MLKQGQDFHVQLVEMILYFFVSRRPFANARVGAEMAYYGQQGFVTGPRGFDEQSAVNHLRKSQLSNEENFMEKIKDWETSTQQK